MKNIMTILAILSFVYCKGQYPIINMYDDNIDYGSVTNAYYKDTENFRDQFVGTWIYTDVNTNTTLKVVFQKRDMMYLPTGRPYYEDFLVGEFQYIENGIEKANTLSNLNVNHTSIWNYNIVGNTKYTGIVMLECDDCPTDVVRLRMRFDEPSNDDFGLSADFVIRHVIENGTEKIKVQFVRTSSAFNSNKENPELPSTSRSFSIPYGNYTLIKQ